MNQTVYAYKIASQVSATTTSRPKINLVNSLGSFILTSKAGHPLTQYELVVKNDTHVNLTSTEQDAIERRIDDIVLAMNMSFKLVALTRKGSSLSFPELSMIAEKIKGIKDPSDTAKVVNETMHNIEKVSVVKGIEEDLDEQLVHTNLSLIDKVDRHSTKKKESKKHNLTKALRTYQDAFDSIADESVFRLIFNSIEEAVDWEGKVQGKGLDIEASVITNIPQSKFEDWRSIYARLKHSDAKGKRLQEYLNAKSRIAQELVLMRPAANTIIRVLYRNICF